MLEWYWCRAEEKLIPEEDLGLDRLLESLQKKVKHQVTI
jgi:hypothetical protein